MMNVYDLMARYDSYMDYEKKEDDFSHENGRPLCIQIRLSDQSKVIVNCVSYFYNAGSFVIPTVDLTKLSDAKSLDDLVKCVNFYFADRYSVADWIKSVYSIAGMLRSYQPGENKVVDMDSFDTDSDNLKLDDAHTQKLLHMIVKKAFATYAVENSRGMLLDAVEKSCKMLFKPAKRAIGPDDTDIHGFLCLKSHGVYDGSYSRPIDDISINPDAVVAIMPIVNANAVYDCRMASVISDVYNRFQGYGISSMRLILKELSWQ